jgi:hypothetical protein
LASRSRTRAGLAWSSLRSGDHPVLLTSTHPPLDIPRLPLLFYFFFEDLGAIPAVLPRAFVASEEDQGIAGFLRSRRRR